MTGRPDVVGIVGLGQMGGAMARTLVRSGWRVVGWDATTAACEAVARDGIEIVEDAAAVAARAAIVVTSLPDAEAVEAVVLGDHGLASAGRDDLFVIDTSTSTPVDARALAARLSELGIAFIDAPVTGGPSGAAAGRLGIMAGGDEASFRLARPVLEALGSTVVLCGPIGSGQVVKACNQLIVVATLGAVAEALSIAGAAGVDVGKAREVLLAGYAASPILENQGGRMLRRDFEPGGKARYNLKDRAALTGLSASTGIEIPVFEAAARYIQALVDAGGGDLDHSAIVTVIETAGGAAGTAGRRPAEGGT